MDGQASADVFPLHTAEAQSPESGSYKYLSETAGRAVGQIRAKWHPCIRDDKQQSTDALALAQAPAAVLTGRGATNQASIQETSRILGCFHTRFVLPRVIPSSSCPHWSLFTLHYSAHLGASVYPCHHDAKERQDDEADQCRSGEPCPTPLFPGGLGDGPWSENGVFY